MKIRKSLFFLLVLLVFICGLALAAGVFFTRSPALVLSDLSFDILYGPWRGILRQGEASLRLFRPVKKVMIAENAESEMVVFALEEASSRPWAVLAPYRFAQGARSYAEKHPETPVLILGGREKFREGRLLGLPADTLLDSYRAGRSAALFFREKEGEILVFQEEPDFPIDREAFLAGLREEGCDTYPLYLSDYTDNPEHDKLSCVVLGGNAQSFLSRHSAVPVILFSWLDPLFSPGNVKLVFDDSPWGVWPAAFRTVLEEGEEPVPSGVFPLFWRIGQWDMLKKMRAVAQEGFAR